ALIHSSRTLCRTCRPSLHRAWRRSDDRAPRTTRPVHAHGSRASRYFFFFKQKTAYDIGLGIPAEPLFRSMAVNIHITIIELNALHTKRQNLFQELDAVIHLLMEAKHWGLRKSRNATSLNSRFKSLDTLKVKIISVTFRR